MYDDKERMKNKINYFNLDNNRFQPKKESKDFDYYDKKWNVRIILLQK